MHFVTHSLGGILVRGYYAVYPPDNIGRVVMLSPPNRGSELADAVRETWLAEVNPVPAVEELGTDPGSVPNMLGPAPFELGVITKGLLAMSKEGALTLEHLGICRRFIPDELKTAEVKPNGDAP